MNDFNETISAKRIIFASILRIIRAHNARLKIRNFNKEHVDISAGCEMLEEASELIGLQVYTQKGIYLGSVNNLVIDLEESKVEGLFINETNPLLVENSKAVNVPYRWISSVGDIILLKHFPKKVALKRSAKGKKKDLSEEIESV